MGLKYLISYQQHLDFARCLSSSPATRSIREEHSRGSLEVPGPTVPERNRSLSQRLRVTLKMQFEETSLQKKK